MKAILAVAALALTACAQVRLADADKKPERVALGMSREQVESLMGISTKTCWRHEAGRFLEEVCFHEGQLIGYTKTPIGVPIGPEGAQVEWWSDWPVRGQSSDMVERRMAGMSAAQVARTWNPPVAIRESYTRAGVDFQADFREGKLVEFRPIERPAYP